jgi:hypothetical protein
MPTHTSLRGALIALLAASAGACQAQNLHIVRQPFVSPIVIPAGPEKKFMLNVAVQNSTDKPHDPVYLRIYTEYFPTPNQSTPCTREIFEHTTAIAAGQSWGLADKVLESGQPGCLCRGDSCHGHVWLSVVWAPVNGPPLPPPDTALHVNWVASGDLAQMTVTPF